MAVADYAALVAELAAPHAVLPINKLSVSVSGGNAAGKPCSYWAATPLAGAIPTAAIAPTKATTGAIERADNPTANAYFAAARLAVSQGFSGLLILCDRLSHQGGLSGTVTTADVTTNLPTAALTRYTSGVGVMAGIEIYTLIGGTATTITCSYTNEAGTAGRTSLPVAIGGGTDRSAAGRMIPISLQLGDSGVRSIESSTLLATTGTAGAFGYVLYRPLAIIPCATPLTTDLNALLGGGGQFDEILDDACLCWLWLGVNTAPLIQGQFTLIEA